MNNKNKFKNLIFKKILPILLVSVLFVSSFIIPTSALTQFVEPNEHTEVPYYIGTTYQDIFHQVNINDSAYNVFNMPFVSNVKYDYFTDEIISFNCPSAISLFDLVYCVQFTDVFLDWANSGVTIENTSKEDFIIYVPFLFLSDYTEVNDHNIYPPSSVSVAIREKGTNNFISSSLLNGYDVQVFTNEFTNEFLWDMSLNNLNFKSFCVKISLDYEQLKYNYALNNNFQIEFRFKCFSNGLNTDKVVGGIFNGRIPYEAHEDKFYMSPLWRNTYFFHNLWRYTAIHTRVIPNFTIPPTEDVLKNELLYGWEGIIYTGETFDDIEGLHSALDHNFDITIGSFQDIVKEFNNGFSFARPLTAASDIFTAFWYDHNFNGLTILVYSSYILGVGAFLIGITHIFSGTLKSGTKRIKKRL